MPHRYFTNEINGNMAALSKEDSRHFACVMRGKTGEELVLCNGSGTDYLAKTVSVLPEKVDLEIISCSKSVSEATIGVTLYIGYPKSDKLEQILQKGTELGAVKFVPFFNKFCVVKPKNELEKNKRYNKIVYEAAKQSGRGTIPTVEMPLEYDEMLKQATKHDAAFFCYEGGGDSLHSRLSTAKAVSVITGSEGGFSRPDFEKALNSGCIPIGLGNRILRCETAPIAALAAIMTLTGNLQ